MKHPVLKRKYKRTIKKSVCNKRSKRSLFKTKYFIMDEVLTSNYYDDQYSIDMHHTATRGNHTRRNVSKLGNVAKLEAQQARRNKSKIGTYA